MVNMHKNKEGRYEITESEYNRIVSICERIMKDTNDESLMDTKKKFTNSEFYPTIEELMTHDIEGNFELYLPYLVYYQDVFTCDERAFRETQKYIADLLYDTLDIIPDEEKEF
jgi:hypothetical protein